MINPVLRREAKTSLRNWKIFYAVAAYVLIITGNCRNFYMAVNV